jgi:hypothetical protein
MFETKSTKYFNVSMTPQKGSKTRSIRHRPRQCCRSWCACIENIGEKKGERIPEKNRKRHHWMDDNNDETFPPSDYLLVVPNKSSKA